MYSINSHVRYSEVGKDGRLTISAAINYMQDCTTSHFESLGLGIETLKKLNRAWLLTSWQLIIHSMPKFNAEIVVKTWPVYFKAFTGLRNFEISSPEGVPYIQANSLWAYVDTESGRPVKPAEEDISRYVLEPPLELSKLERKIRLPENMAEMERLPIRRYQIDTNGHVNNCEYARMAEEYIPENREIKEINIEYRNPSYYGMTLVPKVSIDNNNVYVTLTDEEGKLCSALRFISY